MSTQSTFLNFNTDDADLQPVKKTSESAPNARKNIWQNIVRGFWKYTEKTGAADTSSFEGLL